MIYAHFWWNKEWELQDDMNWEYSNWVRSKPCPRDRNDLMRFMTKWNPTEIISEPPKRFTRSRSLRISKNEAQ